MTIKGALTQAALFPHTSAECWKCHWTAPPGADAPARCPRCRGIACFIEVEDGTAPGAWDLKRLADVKVSKRERLSLQHRALDWFFNGGLVYGCTYLFTAPPGAGKSRWSLQACQFVPGKALYIAAEETALQIKRRAKDLGLVKLLDTVSIVETNDMELVAKNIDDGFDMVVLDSAHRMRTDDSSAPLGSPLQVETVVALACSIARKLGQIWVVVGHVNADGEQSGKIANVHDVDAHVVIEVPDKTRARRILSFNGKHREGPTTRKLSCDMTSRGLDNFEKIRDDTESADAPSED